MHPLTTKIAALHRRLVWRERAVAACRTLAVVVAAATVLGLADFAVRFTDRGLRLMITGALVAVVAWAVYRWWIVPGRRRLLPLSVAQRVEARFPQLRDRLSSAIEFLSQSEHDTMAGSAALRRAVVADAELAVGDLPIESIVDRQPLRQAATWAAILAAAVVLAMIIDAAAVRTAVARMIAPLGATEWPRANHLEFRDPPTRLTAGQPFEVELVDREGPLPEDVRILYRVEHDGRREVQSDWMTRVGDVMVARRDDVRSAFAFRAEGGDDHVMRWLEVDVVEPPQLESLTITTHPPAYTGLPVAAAEAHLEVLAGTGIEVSGDAAEPLRAARIKIGDQTIAAEIRDDAAARERRAFYIASQEWPAAESGEYRLELESIEGVAGDAGAWNLRVEPDTPPSIAWQRPSDDLFVLPTATVPLALAVKDNLAIRQVELRYTRSDQSQDAPDSIELYRGPDAVSTADAVANRERGEMRAVDYAWPLEPLDLPVGTQLTLHVAASDYRPGTGTPTPRRITIITREELDARLADRLVQLVRRLEESLTLERTTRERVRRVEIQLRDAGRLTAGDEDALVAAELNQRQVARGLTDPTDGVPALADALVAELETNGVEDSDTRAQVDDLNQALDRLSAGPLAAAERELTSARKAAATAAEHDDAPPSAVLGSSLAAAAQSQDETIAELENLVSRLSDSADVGRLIRDLATLRSDQLTHLEQTQGEVGLDTLPLEWRELSRQQKATLNQAAAGQEALARRYERIERTMDSLARELATGDSADRLAGAVDLARELQIAGQMRQTTRELGDNRVGQALAREQQIADALEQVLDALRDRAESQTDRLVEGLREAERDLAAIRNELAELREQIADAQQRPGAAADQRRQQQQLRERIKRLSRKLDRLQAPTASRSTNQAADRLADRPNDRPPADSKRVEQAEQDLAEAARQLAQRRREAEANLALEFLRRVQLALATMMADQEEVVRRTAELAAGRRSVDQLADDERQTATQLADKERTLAEKALVQGELISGLHVFVLALGQASDHLNAASAQLGRGETGTATQQAEQQALARLEEIIAALAQTAAELEAEPEQPPGGANAGGQPPGGGRPRPPAFDLFEVKLLRSLQVDLNRRTQAFEGRLADEVSDSDATQAARQQQAGELAAEQNRLAELVAELLSRDNGENDDQ